MKEIVLYEDEDYKKIAREFSQAKDLIEILLYSKDGKNLYGEESYYIKKEDIIKIYHEIKEEG